MSLPQDENPNLPPTPAVKVLSARDEKRIGDQFQFMTEDVQELGL